MALITNNISGSSADSWKVAITGSVLIGNPGARPFPSMPGNDVSFFVSGSVGGKGTADTAVFGGDTVVSGSLTVGTGSITITSNEIQFLGGIAKIYSSSNGLVFADSSGTKTLSSLSTGGGDVTGPGSSTDTAIARFNGLTGKVIQDTAGVTIDGSNNVVSSGSFSTKNGSGNTVTNISNAGVISGSSNLQAGGDLTVAGDAAVNGGDLTTTAATATVFNTNATTVTIAGGATSGTTVGNATGGVTLNGTATVTGDLAVNGATSADLTTTTTTATLFNTTATTVNIAGAATTISLGSSTGTSTVNNNLVIKGDLYVSGTTTTIDSTVVEIQDPVIGLGFASGSVAAAAGDRGFIGGITGAGNNVALVWSNSNTSFVATRTTTAPGSSPVTISNLLPVRVGRLDVNGTAAYITSSDAQTLELNGASGKGTKFLIGAGTEFAQFVDNGANAQFGAVSGKNLILSGTNSVALNVGNAGVIVQRDGTAVGTLGGNSTNFNIGAAAGVLTSSIVNSNVDLINFGGAATSIFVGNSAGNVTFAGDIAVNGGDITTPAATFNLVNSNATTVSFAGAATALNIANGATVAQNLNLATASTGSSTYNLATGATAATATKTINLGTNGLANSTTNINIGSALGSGATVVTGSFQNKGSSTLGNTSADTITFTGRAASSLLPSADVTYDLGSPALRWRNMYTGDLHLRNERGDWTIIEEAEFLSITNNLSGKRYKFVLEEI